MKGTFKTKFNWGTDKLYLYIVYWIKSVLICIKIYHYDCKKKKKKMAGLFKKTFVDIFVLFLLIFVDFWRWHKMLLKFLKKCYNEKKIIVKNICWQKYVVGKQFLSWKNVFGKRKQIVKNKFQKSNVKITKGNGVFIPWNNITDILHWFNHIDAWFANYYLLNIPNDTVTNMLKKSLI